MIKISHYKEVASTNQTLKSLLQNNSPNEITAIMADYQTMGRGQGRNSWLSEPGMNMLMSVFIPLHMDVHDHFFITVLVSMAIHRFLQRRGIAAYVKWPNDIYADDKKLGGLLIENSIMGRQIKHSIIGIGLNVNQTVFDKSLPNPVSMKQLTKIDYKMDEIADQILQVLSAEFEDYHKNNKYQLLAEYNQWLFKKDMPAMFRDADGIFTGKIARVREEGMLEILLPTGEVRKYLHGDVEYIHS